MKILWIVNMVLPPLAAKLKISGGNSGTWMFDIAERLAANPDIEFGVVCVHGAKFQCIIVDRTRYYCLPGNGKDMLFYRNTFEEYYSRIIDDFKPDIVNIHGTEYCHALPFLRKFPSIKSVVSLQGVLNRIKEHDFAGLSCWQIFRYRTLLEYLHCNGMFEMHLLHIKNSQSEQEILRRVNYCVAVDSWHRSCALEINPELKIFEIGYNLRKEFYEAAKWNIKKIHRYEITTNPGGTPLKGLHNLFKATALVKRFYPHVKVKVPGMKSDANGLIVNSGYAKYLKKLIRKLDLQTNIVFCGAQTAEQMLKNMQFAHVQVVPSSIEGPSLVLREGMHLGVPSITSFTGGMADFISDKKDGFLYNFQEYQYLAMRIIEIFESDELAKRLSDNAIKKAELAHNQLKNYQDYLDMYNNICSQ